MFAGVFLGGLTSMPGAVMGGFAIGVLDNLAGAYVSPNFRDTVVFGVIFLDPVPAAVRPVRHRRAGARMMTGPRSRRPCAGPPSLGCRAAGRRRAIATRRRCRATTAASSPPPSPSTRSPCCPSPSWPAPPASGPSGHTAFLALGAYATANLASGRPAGRGRSRPASLRLAAAAVGFVIGTVSGRFSALYFALAHARRHPDVRRADRPPGQPHRAATRAWSPTPSRPGSQPGWAGGTITSDNAPQTAAIVLATLAFVLADLVVKGAPGRRWRAVKSQRVASTAIGLTPYRANAHAFAFSAAPGRPRPASA